MERLPRSTAAAAAAPPAHPLGAPTVRVLPDAAEDGIVGSAHVVLAVAERVGLARYADALVLLRVQDPATRGRVVIPQVHVALGVREVIAVRLGAAEEEEEEEAVVGCRRYWRAGVGVGRRLGRTVCWWGVGCW